MAGDASWRGLGKRGGPVREHSAVGRVFTVLLLGFWVVLTGYPVVWMICTSLRTTADVVSRPWGLPRSLLWRNYLDALTRAPLLRYVGNSLVVSLCSVTLIVLLSAMAAYVFARLSFPGRKTLFYATLLGLAIPAHIALVPLFILNRSIGAADTYWALIGPNVAFGIPFGILMMRGFMLTLPRDLEAAAELDGCSVLSLFWRIFLPLAQSAAAVVAVFSFVGTWNEFLFALTFIHEPSMKTLPIGIMDFVGEFATHWSLMAAAMVLATIPMTGFYVAFQKRLARAMTAGALSG
jgi:raffinose/stachyose/melibiose transport system permease protein